MALLFLILVVGFFAGFFKELIEFGYELGKIAFFIALILFVAAIIFK
jgi:hypothetical protein